MKYDKKQDEHGVYYIDQNNNKAYLSYFKTEEKCIEALDSLKNCKDCIDCNNCKNCTYCSFCTNCHNCHNCHRCTYIDNERNKSNIKITKEQRETYSNNLKDSNKLINDMLGDI